LHQFLNANQNSRHREAMMRHQLMHDLYLTFARFGQRIQIYEPEVDAFGYDIILDDLIRTRRIQIKTKLATAHTGDWMVHKILLRPDITNLNMMPFSPDSGGHGYMGGIILTVADVSQDKVSYTYGYSDALVICARYYGVLAPTTSQQRRSLAATFRELTEPDYRPHRVRIRPPCFWSFSNLRPLLAVAGFDLGYSLHPRQILIDTVARHARRVPGPHSTELDRNAILCANNVLKPLISDP
jgi:hypothetical protein